MTKPRVFFVGSIILAFAVLIAWQGVAEARDSLAIKNSVSVISREDLFRLKNELSASPASLVRSHFLVSWWVHGGEPGPDYVSEAVDLSGTDGQVKGTYLQAIFDFKADPKQSTKKIQKPIDENLAIETLKCIFKSDVLITELAEESDMGMADSLKETWQVEVGSIKVEKTFYGSFPPLMSECRDVFRSVEAKLKGG